jgi:hypothetical protein
MHFMPDTEDADSAAEKFWPEGYKQVIRQDFRQAVAAKFNAGRKLRHVYQQQYSEKFAGLDEFVSKIADMIAIGAENGADNAFDEIMEAFLVEAPLPEGRRYARYFEPKSFSRSIKNNLAQIVIDEYSQDNVYQHAYESYYQRKLPSFDEFIAQVAQTVVIGAMNEADDMLEAIYRSFMASRPLPPARRYPRRLKLWVPA